MQIDLTVGCVLLLAHIALVCAWLWATLCRSALANRSTKLSIRLALLGQGLAGSIALGAPAYGWRPDLVSVVMLASVVAMQIVCSELWRGGVPSQFRKGPAS